MIEKLKINNISKATPVRRRFAANVSSSFILLVAQALANFWLTPFFIGYLGIAAYGMVPLVNTLIAYIQIFTNALNSAVSRFLSIELEKKDFSTANKTFNTALFGIIGIAVVLLPIVILISVFFSSIFNVPVGWEIDSGWLFAFVAITLFITAIASNFAVSPFIQSQFVFSNLVEFIALSSRVGLLIFLFAFFPARLWFVGGGVLLYGLVILIGFYFLWRKLTPELRVQVTAFDRSRLNKISGMGGWVFVNLLGVTLLNRVDLIVINAFFGAALTGSYGAIAQLTILLGRLVTALTRVVRPIFLTKFAQEDFSGLRTLASQSVKLLGLVLALPVGFLCGYSRPFLRIWLGSSFEHLSPLLIMLVFHLSLNLSVSILLFVQNTYNKVKWPGILTLVSGGLNLVLAILFAKWSQLGMIGVALAGVITWTFKNSVYVPIYTARIMKLPWWSYLTDLIPVALGTLFVGLVSYGITQFHFSDNWLTLLGSGVIISLLYSFMVWTVGLNRSDRKLLMSLIPLSPKTKQFIFPQR